MRKFFKWVFIVLLFLIVSGVVTFFIWKNALTPQTEGELKLPGLKEHVEVTFDDFGIPYIHANNKEDLFLAHGYLHARERLFQMDMMRRVGSGRLAEVLGPDLAKTDIFFYSIGLVDYAKKSTQEAAAHHNEEWYKLTESYLEGVNLFIETGFTPVEYTLSGMQKMPFTMEDCFASAGYMAFGFALGQKTDPLAQALFEKHGSGVCEELGLYYDHSRPAIPNWTGETEKLSSGLEAVLGKLPVPQLVGSNAWAVSGAVTASGKPILCNDTHIAHGVPNVWYEAHLECPGFSFMGNFLAGIPFALLGHNSHLGWGVTMLEEDDMDFFVMQESDSLPNRYFHQGQWKSYETQEHQLKIKGRPDSVFTVTKSAIGFVVNDAFDMGTSGKLSMFWTYTSRKNQLLPTFHAMNESHNKADFELALSGIHGPGLNINYADAEGNIGWWACAALPKRKTDGKLFVPGTGEFDITEFYDFAENPRSINPPWNYIYSANNQICMDSIGEVEGYYAPANRASRVVQMLESGSDWNIEKMKTAQTDVRSPIDSAICAIFKEVVLSSQLTDSQKQVAGLLTWDGNHEVDAKSPLLYYKMLFHVMRLGVMDEMGEEWFGNWLGTHWFKNAYSKFLANPEAKTWDNQDTEEMETRDGLIFQAFEISEKSLREEFGDDLDTWNWGKAHHIEMKHPFGLAWPVKQWLNLGPVPIQGGYETVNQTGFRLSAKSDYPVSYGPQIRLIIDFANPENSVNILPCGQSGNVFSPNYHDQFDMYVKGAYRERNFQSIDKEEVEKKLLLVP